MKKQLLYFVLLAFSMMALAVSCGNKKKAGTETMTIASEKRSCVGVGPMECLVVKYDGTDDWLYFYSPIEGFDHEPGYEYVIKVKVTEAENTPADISSLRYELLEVKSKVKKDSENLPAGIINDVDYF